MLESIVQNLLVTARLDARRYQWLRQLDNTFDYVTLKRNWVKKHTPGQLDETIDEAMKGQS